jgi:GWxTD domain-containing protein
MSNIRLARATLLTLILAMLVSVSAGADNKTSVSEGNGPQFVCHVGQRLAADPDTLHLLVSVAIPFDNLVFVRADTGFRTSVEMTTTLYQSNGTLLQERISTVEVRAASFAETSSRTRQAVHDDEFRVLPGDFKVRVTLISETQTRRKSKWEGSISLSKSDPLLRVSDLYWKSEDSTLNASGIPGAVDRLSVSDSIAEAHVQVFSAGKDPIELHWLVLGQKSDTLRRSLTTTTPTGVVQNERYAFLIKDLTPQQFTLRLDAGAGGRHETRTRTFTIRIPGVPASIHNLELAIRELRYIASSGEIKKMLQANGAERQRLFQEFWKKHDQNATGTENPLMEEYYRRVDYSNEHFATNRPGWENDRGRIYIRYGEPTDVERHPFEAGSRPYEIWYYSALALRFEFVDVTGFGDYTLVSPEWGY